MKVEAFFKFSIFGNLGAEAPPFSIRGGIRNLVRNSVKSVENTSTKLLKYSRPNVFHVAKNYDRSGHVSRVSHIPKSENMEQEQLR